MAATSGSKYSFHCASYGHGKAKRSVWCLNARGKQNQVGGEDNRVARFRMVLWDVCLCNTV